MEEDNKKFVIKGEAPESDVEDEVFGEEKKSQTTEGNIIDGEAPESDEEIESFSNLSLTINSMKNPNGSSNVPSNFSPMKQEVNQEHSILHEKLCECNVSLWNNLNFFLQKTAINASKQLNATDQMLVQSQVTLQAASRTIQKVNESTSELLEKTRDLLTTKFLPDIKVDEWS